MKILLIAGGWSSERQISLNSAKNVQAALLKLGHEVTFLDLEHDFQNLLVLAAKHDFAFIGLHGAPGEDGLVQAMLDSIGCPYQGSGAAGSFLALNKAAAKQIFKRAGLETANWEFLPVPPAADWQPALPFPLYVKSNTGGSSLRLGRAQNEDELTRHMREIFAAQEEALIESEIKGREITCGILGDRPLPPILIEAVAGEFFDHESKYAKGGAREICPAPISPDELQKVQELALTAHRALGLAGYSRSDFILDANGNFTILEVNTLPGMTETSLLPQEAKAVGIDFETLISTLIELGLKDHPRKN